MAVGGEAEGATGPRLTEGDADGLYRVSCQAAGGEKGLYLFFHSLDKEENNTDATFLTHH